MKIFNTLTTLLLAALLPASMFAKASTATPITFEKICAQAGIVTTNKVSLGQVQRVHLNADAMLQITTPVADSSAKLLFQRELSKLSLPTDCVEYLVHHSKVEYTNNQTLARVYFDFDKSSLSQESQQILTRITRLIKEKNALINVEGHTDSIGTEDYNLSLALERAHQTEGFLIAQGIDQQHVNSTTLGESTPVADNTKLSGRKLNRRVEVKISQQ